MCNRFIKEFADNVSDHASECHCFALKKSCKDVDFQLTSKKIREVFLKAEIFDLHGYGGKIMTLINFGQEMSDMALCYLHEGDVENFFSLIECAGEYNFWKRRIDENITKELRSKIRKHLSCVSSNLFDNYYVHVGFGDYNERDELIFGRPTYKTDNKNLKKRNEYIVISLSYWLQIFITKENPRSHLYNILKAEGDISKFLDFKLRMPQYKSKEKKFVGNFPEKLIKNILENLKCDCVYSNYTPKNVRDTLKTFDYKDPEIIYRKTGIFDEDYNYTGSIPQYFNFALDYLYEKNYVDFFNIVSQIGVNEEIIKAVDKISYSDVKDYRVNINVRWKACKLYNKHEYKNNIKNYIEYDFQSDDEKVSNFGRYHIPYSERFLNITYDRWLSDVISHQNPFKKWKLLLENGLKYELNTFL